MSNTKTRWFRLFNVVDDFPRECVPQIVDFSISRANAYAVSSIAWRALDDCGGQSSATTAPT